MSAIGPGDLVAYVGRENNLCDEDHRPANRKHGLHGLVRGRVYSVESITRLSACGLGLFLREVPTSNPAGLCHGIFRKIDAPKTEIADRIKACRPLTAPARPALKVVG